jgi:hypothetical protein
VPPLTMKATLEINLLVGAGLAADELSITKRLVKLNTGMVYRQQKYNIIREETEGFTHLLAVLNALPTNPSHSSNSVTQVLSTIGHFDLDPNRVLDVILDVFELNTWNESFISLIKHFRKGSIAPIVGAKFTSYHSKIAVGTEQSTSEKPHDESGSRRNTFDSTPATLCGLAAVLLSHKLIDLMDLLPYLAPSIDDTVRTWLAFEADQKKQIQSFGVVSLTGTAPVTSASNLSAASNASASSSGTSSLGLPVKPPPPPTPAPAHGRPPLPPVPPPGIEAGADVKVPFSGLYLI